MQVLSFAFSRGLTRNVLLATGSLALASLSTTASGQTPVPEKKPEVQKPAPAKPEPKKAAVTSIPIPMDRVHVRLRGAREGHRAKASTTFRRHSKIRTTTFLSRLRIQDQPQSTIDD